MASNPALELASAIQSASINRAPSPTHDINPSTSASAKIPVTLTQEASSSTIQNPSPSQSHPDATDPYDSEDGIELDDDDIPYSVLRPAPRRASFGPLPDMRFEQSYLASIAGAETKSRVAWITVRDQVFLPLLQGTLWNLALYGWRHWNRSASLSGQGVGSRVRRWWYKTNNWKLPDFKRVARSRNLADEAGDFYQNRSALD